MTLAQVSAHYLAGLTPEKRAEDQGELNKFIRWYGSDRPVAVLSIRDVDRYAEAASSWGGDVSRRLEPVRSFLLYLKQEKATTVNLAVHLKWRKGTARAAVVPKVRSSPAANLTPEGFTQLETELTTLKAERPQIAEALRTAAADKDFRENSPLDAARERQGHVEGRIRELEGLLHSSSMAPAPATSPNPDSKADLGTLVVLRDMDKGAELRCTLVSPAEASLQGGKLSITSPLGKALMDKGPGEVVEVKAPAGMFRYRIESVQH